MYIYEYVIQKYITLYFLEIENVPFLIFFVQIRQQRMYFYHYIPIVIIQI